MRELINIGTSPNDGVGDRINDACKKINYNFDLVLKKLNKLNKSIELKRIVWNDLSDTRKAMMDVNDNFDKIDDILKSIK